MSFTVSINELVENSSNPLLGAAPGWKRVQIGEIANVINGFAFPSEKFNATKGKPLIRIRDILKGETNTFFDGPYNENYLVKTGDLLIGMDGDFNCDLWKGQEGLLNQRVCKIVITSPDYDLKFLSYVLPGYLQAINEKTSSVTVKHLSSNTVSKIPVPFPPWTNSSGSSPGSKNCSPNWMPESPRWRRSARR